MHEDQRCKYNYYMCTQSDWSLGVELFLVFHPNIPPLQLRMLKGQFEDDNHRG